MSTKTPKFMTDSDGNQVPIKHVNAWDRLRDRKVRAIHSRWSKTREALEKCMEACLRDLQDLQGARALLPNGDLAPRGNFSVTSFDGLIHVQIKQHYRIMLDDRSIQARDIMLDFAKRIVGRIEGVDAQFLYQLVEDTFKPTSSGALPVGKVLSLLRYKIKDMAWIRARDMLADSIKPERGKAYLIVGVKADHQHDLKTIRLDAADCWPVESDPR